MIIPNMGYMSVMKDKFETLLSGMGVIQPNSMPLIEPFDLRLEQSLKNNVGEYTFKFSETHGNTKDEECRLVDGEAFLPLFAAINIKREENDSTAPNFNANYILHTFPDPQVFIGNNTTGHTEVDALELLYQGKLNMWSDGTMIQQDMSTHHARLSNPEKVYQYGPTIRERGYFPLHNDFVYWGGQQGEARLTIGDGNNSLIAGGVNDLNEPITQTNKVVLFLYGFRFRQSLTGKAKLCRV